MKFIEYSSIKNSYQEKFIDKMIAENKISGTWVVTEKIHGANFSLWYDGSKLRLAKRTGWIADDDNFFGVQRLKDGLIEKVKFAFDLMKLKKKEYIAIFGELHGGTYPHPEVKVDPKAKKVQKGVYYCPHNDFVVYDIKINGRFLNFDDMQKLCEEVGLRFVVALFAGTFKECLEYPNDFKSMIHEEHGLPEIKDNICEGIVIRPNNARFLYNQSRVMLKSKNDKFKEKERKPKAKWTPAKLSDVGRVAFETMCSMITENRYDAVVSKIGEVSLKDFGKLQGAVMKDIHEEFMEDTKLYLDYNNLGKAERKMVSRKVGKGVADLIRKKIMEKK